MDPTIQTIVERYFNPFQEAVLQKAREKARGRLSEWETLLESLKKAVPGYVVRDFTNLDNDWCFIAEVLLHKHQDSFLDDDKELLRHLGGKKRSLTLFVSVIAPYYYFYVSEMQYDVVDNQFVFSYYQPTELELEEVIQPIRNIMKSKSCRFLPPELAKKVLPDIETECLEKGQVTAFHCLFSEMFSPH